ncbi:MAG: patatin [Bacteroidetes bacterium]|nr:MAG: patatin [Bacteroidota bacterium]
MTNIGLALSGGGARALQHIGVLQALEEFHIFPKAISGASAGAIIGSLYAEGYSPKEMIDIFLKTKIFQMFRFSFKTSGLLNIEVLDGICKQYFKENSFEHLRIPLFVNATDIFDHKTHYFSQGELFKPLQASSCIPVIFKPVFFQERNWVDGGLLNNLPVEPLLNSCQTIIGSTCNPVVNITKVPKMNKMLERTFQILVNANVAPQKKHCQIWIEPPLLSKFTIYDFGKVKEIAKVAYEYTKNILENNLVLTSENLIMKPLEQA